VVGIIPPAGNGHHAEYIVLGAHYDHIADDNASGTATVLELTAALIEEKQRHPERFRRGVVVGLWSGEALGGIGSSYFTENPPIPSEAWAAYLNVDRVGWLNDNKLMMQGVASSDAWPEMIERRNVAAGFNVVSQDDPHLPSDVTAFYQKKVPVLRFFTGSDEDHHRPTGDAETLDYEGMERIGRFAFNIASDLLAAEERPSYVEVDRSKEATGGHPSLRAYLGTIPDYAAEGIEGVKLTGVRAGGPAEEAGLRGGDVIVEFGGRKITNIYDYSDALEALKIGEPVLVVVMRDDKRIELSVVPGTRE
jgi:hypothetical protein